MKIRGKITALLLLAALAPLGAAMSIALTQASARVKALTIRAASERVQASAEDLSGYFRARRAEILALANSPRVLRMNWEEIRPWLQQEVARKAGVYEKVILGLPDGRFHNTATGNPARGGFVSFDDSDPDATLRSIADQPYWRILVGDNIDAEPRTHVSNPMISYSTGVRQVVVGATIRSEDGVLLGMLGGAISWEEIKRRIDAIRDRILNDFGEDVHISLVDRDGIYVYHWDPEKVVRLLLDHQGRPVANEIGENTIILHQVTEEDITELAAAGARMVKGDVGHAFYDARAGKDRLAVIFSPVRSARYSLAMILPESVIMAPVARLRSLFIVVIGATILFCVAVAIGLSGRISRPIIGLRDAAARVAAGDWDTRVIARGRDEINELGLAFNQMAGDLGQLVRRLGEEEASRARIEKDLEIAHEIQSGLLPREPLEIPGFEVVGWNQPADKTGGDYFDWQMVPDGRWAISVADVTGHGIGPALVTAFCRAYSRASLPVVGDLGHAMDQINDLIHADMPPGRFVTFVVAILDPTNATLDLLSAGHGPLFFYEASTGTVRVMGAQLFPLGIEMDVGYGPVERLVFQPGDMLVLATDGFFEWRNDSGEQFGIERLRETIATAASLPAERIITEIHQRVVAFATGSKQEDDLTIVVIKRSVEC